MTNQTSSSQKRTQRKQANLKIREMAAKGEWPPVGHPWRALALLPKEEQALLFQGQGWRAVAEGLGLLRDQAINLCSNTGKPSPLRDEACGIIHLVDVLVHLEAEVAAFRKLVEPDEGSK
jgi:hypothetical protein